MSREGYEGKVPRVLGNQRKGPPGTQISSSKEGTAHPLWEGRPRGRVLQILLCRRTRQDAEDPVQRVVLWPGFLARQKGQLQPQLTARPARSRHKAAWACRSKPPEPEVTRAARHECASGSTTDCTSHGGSQNPNGWLSRHEMIQIQLRGHLGIFLIPSWEISNLHPSAFLHPLEPGTVDGTRIWESPGPQRQLYCWGVALREVTFLF